MLTFFSCVHNFQQTPTKNYPYPFFGILGPRRWYPWSLGITSRGHLAAAFPHMMACQASFSRFCSLFRKYFNMIVKECALVSFQADFVDLSQNDCHSCKHLTLKCNSDTTEVVSELHFLPLYSLQDAQREPCPLSRMQHLPILYERR